MKTAWTLGQFYSILKPAPILQPLIEKHVKLNINVKQ